MRPWRRSRESKRRRTCWPIFRSRLAGALVFSGHGDESAVVNEEALTLAQHHELADPLVRGLNSKAILHTVRGRAEEARMLFEGAAAVARVHGLTQSEMLAEGNLADLSMYADLPGAEDHAKAALVLARRWGLRQVEAWSASNLMYILTMAGQLDEARRVGTELLGGGDERAGAGDIYFRLAGLDVLRGNIDAAREHLAGCSDWAGSDNVQYRAGYAVAEAQVLLGEGKAREALEAARRALDEVMSGGLSVAHEVVRIGFPIALEAAIDAGEIEDADRLAAMLAGRPRGEVPRSCVHRSPAQGRSFAGARGDDEAVEENLVSAEGALRELGYPSWTASVQLDRAEWLARQGRLEESIRLAAEAGETAEALGMAPMLARAGAVRA